MSPFDATIVNLALPAMGASLGVSVSGLIWIPTVYLVAIASLETALGRLADVKGKRRLLVSALATFVAGSLIASLSMNIAQLILARIIQGIGAAGMDSAGNALIADSFPLQRRGRAFGINQMVVYLGITSGPLAGGVLVQTLGWRSIFYINIPIGIVAIALSLLFIKEESLSQKVVEQRFDILGSASLAAFLTTLLAIFNESQLNLSTLGNEILEAACVLSFLAFVFIEAKVAKAPLLDLSLFTHNRLFAAGISTSLMNYLTVYGTFFVLSIYLQSILGYSPVNAGLILLSQAVMMMVSSPIAGFLSERISARVLSSLGMGLKSVAFFFLASLNVNSPTEYIVVSLLVIGIGHGFFSSPNVGSVISSVGADRFGLASGALGTIRTSGQSIGIALLGSVAASRLPAGALLLNNSSAVISGALASEFTAGLSIAFYIASGICAIGVFTSLMRGKKQAQEGSSALP